MGNRNAIMSLLVFADKVQPELWGGHEEILAQMDLKGYYQSKNLRTALAALEVLLDSADDSIVDAIVHTAERTGFRGRWEKVSDDPYMICDIGHNEHGLKYNFAQLEKMKQTGEVSKLIIVYGSVADKDLDAVLPLMPQDASYIFTQASSKRALPAAVIREKYEAFCKSAGRKCGEVYCCETVDKAMAKARELASDAPGSMVYVGGSTYVVSEAVDHK
jgi:dihydrofolate synthase/folylpolyglutamate synthase